VCSFRLQVCSALSFSSRSVEIVEQSAAALMPSGASRLNPLFAPWDATEIRLPSFQNGQDVPAGASGHVEVIRDTPGQWSMSDDPSA